MTIDERYYVIRCYNSFNEFYKLCKQIKCIYYKKQNVREAWLTPEQFTLFSLSTNDERFIGFMIRAYGPPDIYDDNVNMSFIDTFGPAI